MNKDPVGHAAAGAHGAGAADRLRRSEAMLHKTQRFANVGGWELDLARNAVSWSEQMFAIFGLDPAHFSGGYVEYLARIHPEDLARVQAHSAAARNHAYGPNLDLEYRIVRPDGTVRTVHERGEITFDESGVPLAAAGVVMDISERTLADRELARTTRALKMLSRCNEAMVRVPNEGALLEEICRIAVVEGGYRMASVAYAQDDEKRTVVPVCHAGHEAGYFSAITLSWSAERADGRGPAGRTLRTGSSVVIADLANDETYALWAKPALARGYRSVVSLPLKTGGRCFGIFALYSAEPRTIGPAEVELLHELADNLAYGITAMRDRTDRQVLLDTVTAVSESAAGSTGADYFETLLKILVRSLDGHAGFVAGTPDEATGLVRTICAVIDGELVPNVQYPLAGTPCADIGATNSLVIERNVRGLYPAAGALAALDPQAYVGMNLLDSSGAAIGTLFVLYRRPLTHRALALAMLRLFATRVASELERQRDDTRLREQALLLDKAHDAIFLCTLDQRIIYWNEGAQRLYGWTAAEAVGRVTRELQLIEDAEFVAARDRLLVQDEWAGELRGTRKDGAVVTVACRWTLMRAADGTPQSILAINTDISARKRTESHLRLLETSVARLNDILLITEAEPLGEPGPRIVFVNDAFVRRTGYSREEALGRTPRILQGPATSRAELDRIRKSLLAWQPVRSELVNYTKSGEEFWIELDIVPLANADGWYTHWVSVERDITERKRAETLLAESEARAAHAHKLESIGRLTGGIAHDFNNLLTVIIGNADMLAAELHHAPALAALAAMARTAGERAAELTNRLLAFARRQALEPKYLRPRDNILGMLPLLRRTLGENIQIIEAVQSQDSGFVYIDPGQLESAILNLCINARDAMPDGGRLTLSTRNVTLEGSRAGDDHDMVPGDYVVVTIADTGAGIPAEQMERIFDPFFTTKPTGKGTGLGLSMVYGFTKQSGGTVHIESSVGVGTTVKMYLPRTEQAAAERTASLDGATSPELRGREIVLLVEDDDLVRRHVAQLLSGLGYRVIEAADGRHALEIASSDQPLDLLFTDVMMPGELNGPQLAGRIDAIRPGLPVLYTSGYTENVLVHRDGVDSEVNLLHKPYSRLKLAEKLREVLAPGAHGHRE